VTPTRAFASLLLASSLLACAAPVLADPAGPPVAAPTAPPVAAPAGDADGIPDQLSTDQRAAYRTIFASIRDGHWSDAQGGIAGAGDGLLTPIARAELYLAKDSPRVALTPLLDLLAKAPELPEATQLVLLAKKRGATTLPDIPQERDLVSYKGAPSRTSAASATDTTAATLAPLLKADQPAAAETIFNASQAQLAPDERTEWQQRISWSYYLNGDDVNAARLAALARAGSGQWAAQADWVAGLAAWRRGDCKAAGEAFGSVAGRALDSEMRAAGLFWAARADMACGRPQLVQARLRTAARIPETFYGLLAARTLSLPVSSKAAMPALVPDEWAKLSAYPNVRVAVALSEIGEYGLADEIIRHQAKLGPDGDHTPLLHLAARLDLPATQIWLAKNAPAGGQPDMAARYPVPNWTPQGGWRIDKALVFAHALQESQFRTDAVSPAGAWGVLQVLPSTANLIEKKRGGAPVQKSTLVDPRVNLDYAQSYLQQLASAVQTGGLLPKVIAAYNAGPGNVVKWNATGAAARDPLLYIESIPFKETRGYVAAVLRNYWMYDRQTGEAAASLKAIAQGLWPRFPGLQATTAMSGPAASGN
jgi:soluble lytic murein transglycosylase